MRDHPQITFRSIELVRDGDVWRLRNLQLSLQCGRLAGDLVQRTTADFW